MMVVKIQESAVDMRACAIDDRDMRRVHASSLQMHNFLFALSHRLQVVSKLLVPSSSYLAKEVPNNPIDKINARDLLFYCRRRRQRFAILPASHFGNPKNAVDQILSFPFPCIGCCRWR